MREFPVFVIISPDEDALNVKDYDYFSPLLPETGYILISDIEGRLKQLFLDDGKTENFSGLKFKECRILEPEHIIPADGTCFFMALKDSPVINEDDLYAQAVFMAENYKKMLYNPSLETTYLPELVRQSKKSGIMIPITSYIVLENSAQWAMLERKEKQKLENFDELEIEEIKSPAPSAIFLILCFLFCVCVYNKTKKIFCNTIK